MECTNCKDTGWVCENHPDQPWVGGMPKGFIGCCGGAGDPCPKCNPCDEYNPPRELKGLKIILDKDGFRH